MVKFIIRILFIFLLFLSLLLNAEGKIFFDETGRKLSISSEPKRIISLAPSVTEELYYLGVMKRVVGVTKFSNFPDMAKKLPKVGTYIHLDLEKIVSLKPDLVIGVKGHTPPGSIRKIEDMGFNIYFVNPKKVDDIFISMMNIGRILGIEKKTKKIVANFRKKWEMIKKKREKGKEVKVFYQLGLNPMITIGKGTYQDDLLNKLKMINIAGKNNIKYPIYSIEKVILGRPDIILISPMGGTMDIKKAYGYWKNWVNIPAVKNKKIFVVPNDLLDRPSPRIFENLSDFVDMIFKNKRIFSKKF